MSDKFDDLIREGRDTDALRLMARGMYENGKVGHTRMSMMVRVADELDQKSRELSFTRGKQQKKSIRDFLVGIASEVLTGEKYTHRIEIDDGGINSYIGFNVDVEDWKHKPHKATGSIRIFRNTNSANKLQNEWKFSLGNICHPYCDNPGMPLEFTSYGKTPDEAEAEAEKYFSEIRKLVRKQTSVYKIEKAASEQEEREKLLARLSELEATP